jgi:glycosyltransferase involved in cell wall biosynthesis
MKDKQLNIMKLFDDNYPATGGYQSLVSDLVPVLENKHNIDVSIVCHNESSSSGKETTIYPVLLPPTKIPTKIGTIFCIFYNWIAITRVLLKSKPDVVHAHQAYIAGVYAFPCVFFDIPLVCTSHGSDIQLNKEKNYGVRRNKIKSVLVKFALSYVSRHIIVSESMRNAALNAGSSERKIEVVYNGIDHNKATFPEEPSITIDDSYFNILYLGRIIDKKNPSDLIKILPDLIKSDIDFHLTMAGPGNINKLKKLAEKIGVDEYVTFTGFISEESKWHLYSNCDVYILPSQTEGHPITILEAGITGCPVIVPDREPFSIFLNNYQSAIFYNPEDLFSLSSAIQDLSHCPENREQIRKGLEDLVNEEFLIGETADEYVKIYSDLIVNESE